MSSFIIGLTGGVGSGKSTIAHLFATHGIEIIDADKITHEILQNDATVLEKIIAQFGEDILTAQHQLNRRALREIIFANADQRKWLEQLLHPLIYTQMDQQAEQARSTYCIEVIPLLNTRDKKKINRVLVVDASEADQIRRIMERDDITEQQAQAILKAQITRAQRLALADDIIINDHNIEHLKEQVQKLHRFYLSLA